ncbi:MAG: hypothetical protein KF791_16965 [Verrucomicrobiae bacterium]|nr:hypothetical protein [Verrucomicrobiae bacterium]
MIRRLFHRLHNWLVPVVPRRYPVTGGRNPHAVRRRIRRNIRRLLHVPQPLRGGSSV